jgi:hypothetical protein
VLSIILIGPLTFGIPVWLLAQELLLHSLLFAAEMISLLLPSIIANTRMAPEDVLWVNCSLDFQQALVVLTPE